MKRAIISLIIVLSVLLSSYNSCNAAPLVPEGLSMGHATAYCVSGTTKSGAQTRRGICAGKEEWLGKTVILYQRLPNNSIGDIIGIYECLDTGGTEGLKFGKVIDVWTENIDEAQKFMDLVYEDGCKGNIYIQVLDAEG